MEFLATLKVVLAILAVLSPFIVWGIRTLAKQALDARLEEYKEDIRAVRDEILEAKINRAEVQTDIKHILAALARLERV